MELVKKKFFFLIFYYKLLARCEELLSHICSKNSNFVSFLKESQKKATELYRKEMEEEEKREFSLNSLLNEPQTRMTRVFIISF